MGVEPTQTDTIKLRLLHQARHTKNVCSAILSDINPVCLHALGFLLLASSIPRTTVHRLLPTIHHNDVFLTAAYFVTLFVSACNLKGR